MTQKNARNESPEMITYGKQSICRFGSAEKQVPVASEQVPVASKRVLVASESGRVASELVPIGYVLCWGNLLPPVAFAVSSESWNGGGRFITLCAWPET